MAARVDSVAKMQRSRLQARAKASCAADRLRIGAIHPTPAAYDRRRILARLLPLWPHELEDESPEGRRRILAKLRRALRAERRRGIAGHWTYDLARHVELLWVYREETNAMGGGQANNHPLDGAG
jgi:hypothetical protein